MFEFWFKYPRTVFEKGELLFVSGWPVWLLWTVVALLAGILGWISWQKRVKGAPALAGKRWIVLWLLQTGMAALLAVLLWRPAVSVSTLKPHQNIVAVVVDDSASMGIEEDGKKRVERAREVLESSAIKEVAKNFQVRLYRFGSELVPIKEARELQGTGQATQISSVLRQIAAEAGSLPIGAVILVSDGADNSGGVDRETLAELRRYKLPVHTIGIGREEFRQDVELLDVTLPPKTLADSRVALDVTFRQAGFAGRKTGLRVAEGDKVLATREVTLGRDGAGQTETVLVNAGIAGIKTLTVTLEPLDGERNMKNNSLTRLLQVEALKPRILYIEGEQRWEYKFIRRALEEDRSLQLVSLTRTTQNKLYRQGIDPANPKELEDGFPSRAEELFVFSGLIIGTIEAPYFTPAQQELIKEFASRRGGGVLFLGGRASLSDGGWAASSVAEIMPVILPAKKGTFHRDPAVAALTPVGKESLLCRLVEDPEKNAERWKKMPALADYQEPGEPKPGAMVLLEAMTEGRRSYPLLVIQNYGLGRTAVFATGGSWRWQMLQDSRDLTHETFWQQLARWLVNGTPTPVMVSTTRAVLHDEGKVGIQVQVRDKAYSPVADAMVEAHILGPGGTEGTVELTPAAEPGTYAGEWLAARPGVYVVEAIARRGEEVLGHGQAAFVREDGVAENFRTEQNRELLEKLAEDTRGKYFRPDNLNDLAREVSYSEAGLVVREARELWDMPVLLVLLLAMRAAEWLLKRRWGAV